MKRSIEYLEQEAALVENVFLYEYLEKLERLDRLKAHIEKGTCALVFSWIALISRRPGPHEEFARADRAPHRGARQASLPRRSRLIDQS